MDRPNGVSGPTGQPPSVPQFSFAASSSRARRPSRTSSKLWFEITEQRQFQEERISWDDWRFWPGDRGRTTGVWNTMNHQFWRRSRIKNIILNIFVFFHVFLKPTTQANEAQWEYGNEHQRCFLQETTADGHLYTSRRRTLHSVLHELAISQF